MCCGIVLSAAVHAACSSGGSSILGAVTASSGGSRVPLSLAAPLCLSVLLVHTAAHPPARTPAHACFLPLACPACSYEGLMLNEVPHNKGVLVLGNGLGGGIQKAARGDRYEGAWPASQRACGPAGQWVHMHDTTAGNRPPVAALCCRRQAAAVAQQAQQVQQPRAVARAHAPPLTAAPLLLPCTAPAGEFDTGFAHGMGQYTSTKGKVYRGEWSTGLRHGCAARVLCMLPLSDALRCCSMLHALCCAAALLLVAARAAALRACRCGAACSPLAAHLLVPKRRCGVEYDTTPFLKRVDGGMDPDAVR